MKHGHACVRTKGLSREYRSYLAMKRRCLEPKSGSYARYGGRGITVDSRWLESFENFLADVGLAPSRTHQLDRIDPDGNYEPGNVRWVTARENNRTRRNRRWVTYRGQRMLLADACEIAGLAVKVVEARLGMGWSEEQSLSTPNEHLHTSRDPMLRLLQVHARRVGVDWAVVRKRLLRGWKVYPAYHGQPRPKAKVGPDGRFLPGRRTP